MRYLVPEKNSLCIRLQSLTVHEVDRDDEALISCKNAFTCSFCNLFLWGEISNLLPNSLKNEFKELCSHSFTQRTALFLQITWAFWCFVLCFAWWLLLSVLLLFKESISRCIEQITSCCNRPIGSTLFHGLMFVVFCYVRASEWIIEDQHLTNKCQVLLLNHFLFFLLSCIYILHCYSTHPYLSFVGSLKALHRNQIVCSVHYLRTHSHSCMVKTITGAPLNFL